MNEQSINADGYKEFLDACALVRSFGYEIAVIGQTDALRVRIAELEAARRWVPVGKMLPKKDKKYPAFSCNVMVITGITNYDEYELTVGYVRYSDCEWTEIYSGDAIKPLFWQPLPAVPEVE